ncbi:MAG: trmE [Chlamydiales bacterium]|jgi:tRNA modification GTPase|nr:trmE [Chlamydiales bacterium]
MTSPYQLNDTIAAIATPPGEGGVAIIRISGKDSISIAQKIYSGNISSYKSHTAHYGKIKDLEGKFVDNVLLLYMKNPKSYTGEDTIEVHCHGGSLISRKVLEIILQAGARPAQPGEFTFRAFFNGKVDLSQAEAVQSLIGAKNELALLAAEDQLEGKLSRRISEIQNKLLDITAILEAWVDFPEEGLEFASIEEIQQSLNGIINEMQHLQNTFHEGRLIHNGISLCLIGKPNVGKSSLMNALLGKDRAIVTDVPGTTRDLLEDTLLLNGLNFRLIDTAGIRETTEQIEQEGIRRSQQAMEEADLILLVLDVTRLLEAEDQLLLNKVPLHKTLVIWNKIDQVHDPLPSIAFPYQVQVSAKQYQGLEKLSAAIDQILWKHGHPSKEEIVITNIRHKDAIAQAIQFATRVTYGLESGISPEFLTADIRGCLKELGKIIGMDITEEVLSSIFSKFCIGK